MAGIDRLIERLDRFSASSVPSAGEQQLDPQLIAKALAQALLYDNSITQQIAIRIGNLQTKYPKRAA